MGKFENLPKVGDRVKIVASDVVSHWNMHWANEVGARLSNGDLVYVSKVTPRYLDGQAGLTIAATPGGDGPRWTIDRFAPVDNATLSIEAGKFYKTRDGRKVGPMKYWSGRRDGLCEEVGDGRYWSFDGVGHNKATGEDLIAELVDEPIAQPAKASNDNAEPTLGDILQAAIGKRVTVKVKTPKYKVGDIVKRANGFQPHQRLRITKADGDNYSVECLVGGPGSIDKGRGYEFELVTPAAPTNPAIVCLIENGQPKPSTYPHVHVDEGAASKEASRLASVHKGQKFGVYVLTQTVSEEKVYAHEWQNLAIKGEKIGAIKALRAANDLTLKGAKDAVEHWLELNAA